MALGHFLACCINYIVVCEDLHGMVVPVELRSVRDILQVKHTTIISFDAYRLKKNKWLWENKFDASVQESVLYGLVTGQFKLQDELI